MRLERALHVYAEPRVQQLVQGAPGAIGTVGVAYLTLHLSVTAALLLWLHRRRPAAYPIVRTTLIAASTLSLIAFLAFPTAPPRLAGTGLVDTVSRGSVDLDRGLVSALYNRYAAVPSLHAGYALLVGAALVRYGRARLLRAVGAIYPPFVLLAVVATGNHFFLDAAIGGLVAAGSVAVALALVGRGVG